SPRGRLRRAADCRVLEGSCEGRASSWRMGDQAGRGRREAAIAELLRRLRTTHPRRSTAASRRGARRTLLEDRRLGVAAEDGLERVDQLALSRLGAGGGEQRLHQVRALPRGGGTDGAERLLDGDRVAACADGSDAVDLLALEGRVDLEDR